MAREIRADERAAKALLDLLVPLGYLKVRGELYSNTPASRPFASGSSFNWADTFELYRGLHTFILENEENAIREGRPQVNAFEWFTQHPPMWKLFHSFEMSIARQSQRDIVSKVKISPSAVRLIDVGGGHGLYSIMLCKQHPTLRATVFDSPTVIEETKKIVESEGMKEWVDTRVGDFFTDDMGSGYDVALLFNIIHLFNPEQNSHLLKRVAGSLSPGGSVVIFDQFLGGEFGNIVRTAHAFYNFLFLVTTGAQLYSFYETSGMLAKSGFGAPTSKSVRSAGSTLVFSIRSA
jgi:2-polyprenyl-3-methyl-5-hydroxy-6-metoxy-1,4-benzoquinol methylase